jgi:ABC-type multidrug transport system fused ATPase/permease subunit
MLQLISNLWEEIPRNRKKQLKLLLVLMVLSSIFEVISIGLVIPFLTILVDPARFAQQSYLQPYLNEIGLNNPKSSAYFFTILFCGAFVCAGIIRLLTQWLNIKVSFAIGSELSIKLFNSTMHQTYENHMLRNSSEIINTISVKMGYLMNAISSIITLASSAIIVILICTILMIANVLYTAIIFLILLTFYLGINSVSKKILIKNSERISNNSGLTIKILQESFGSYRDIVLDNSQKFHVQEFGKANKVLWESEGTVRLMSIAPRYLIETLGLITISITALILTLNGETITGLLPLIGALVLAIQRMLPAMQSIYSSWAGIRGSQDMIIDTIRMMRESNIKLLENCNINKMVFKKEIEFKNIHFKYGKSLQFALKEVNIKIKHGEKIGIIGSSGSGKSTFIDLFMGLLKSNFGEIYIDGQLLNQSNLLMWQKKIGHVPQSIYITDDSIAENIAFNIPKEIIDFNKVAWAAKQAQISDYIETLPDKYSTIVGERGGRLSGGQRQRIGIARALYKEAELIIFDEATSALDHETEDSIIDSIKVLSPELTVVIISHKLECLRICDRILEVKDGTLSELK